MATKLKRRTLLQAAAAAPLLAAEFTLPKNITRAWIGPEYWANPLQDWRLRDGRMECIVSGGDRNVALLTLDTPPGAFELSVLLGRFDDADLTPGYVGFRLGSRGYFNDYRDSAIRGTGLDCGVSTDGQLFIGEPPSGAKQIDLAAPLRLVLSGDGRNLRLRAFSQEGKQLAELQRRVAQSSLSGGVALVCSAGEIRPTPRKREIAVVGFNSRPGTAREGNVRFWFSELKASGFASRPERAWGPLLFSQYTVTRNVLKMTVQLAPLEREGSVELEIRREGKWLAPAKGPVDVFSATAQLRVEPWAANLDVPYRVRYEGYQLEGTIRHDPVEKNRIVIGSLTCQADMGYPHARTVKSVAAHKPDILFFTGDQIYERNGDYGNQTAPLDAARLDYLRKWFLFGWAWGGLTRDIPCVCLPDDHDVFHGNLWGAGGRKAIGDGQPGQDSGGYKMPAKWVRMVEATQSSHLPDPPDPTPVAQGIGVHYCHLRWGGVSFAVLEDRKWKSAPKEFLPGARIINGWPQNTDWNAARDGDVAGAQLLGPRQERFLEEWAADWSGGAWMKMVVSATILCNLATLPPPATTDAITNKLPILKPGEYAEGEVKTMDHDSNAWPQTPRNRALRFMRKALAVHLAGDQHLGSTVQYGVDRHDDAAWALCSPSISNIFPRRWFPQEAGRNGKERNLGEYLDGFGNRMTVHAVANPMQFGEPPAALYDRAIGYGIVEVFKDSRRIVFANWPGFGDASKTGAKPYRGWPIAIHQQDNGLPRGAVLAEVVAKAGPLPVLEVRTEAGELLYCFRMGARRFAPPVPGKGRYRVRLYEPDTGIEQLNEVREA